MSATPPFHFTDNGESFVVKNPLSLEQADWDLWNDAFCARVTQAGTCQGQVFIPNGQSYAEAPRPVYAKDVGNGRLWSLSWGPVHGAADSYAFTIRRDQVCWHQSVDGIESMLRLSVPREAGLEAWQLTVTNQSRRARSLELTPTIPTGLLGLLDHGSLLCDEPFGILHHYFPYYVKIEDYEKMAARWNTTFFYTSERPVSWTAREQDFLGLGGWKHPDALGPGRLGERHCHYERGLCAARFRVDLEPGEVRKLGWILGPARNPEHARELAAAYPPGQAFDVAIAEQTAFWNQQKIPLHVSSPDPDFDAYINHWSPDRSIRIGRTLRFNPAPQARNAIQDTMTQALFDPEAARRRFMAIWGHQDKDGFMPHGLPMFPGAELMPITLIPHKDTNSWGPLALDLYFRETNDFSLLEESIPWRDGGSSSLAEHLEQGLSWLLDQRSPRGLSLIGQGDWNDPLNMAGPEGRGESVWLSQALIVALETWARICSKSGRDPHRWKTAAESVRVAVREHAWDGSWFLRATSDDGHRIGSRDSEYGKIYLNAQSWAIMAGVATDEQIEAMVQAVDDLLGTRIAPALLAPPYPGMVPHVGKLTLKTPGTGENGSVYSHAALFWSHALYACGRSTQAWRILRNLVPGGPDNPVEAAGQVPLYIPNFYRGPAFPEIFGRSSYSPNTGSAAWVYMTFIEQVVGLRGEGSYLRVQPNLPSEWDRISGVRHFRGTAYTFSIERDPSISDVEIKVDGKPSTTEILWTGSSKSDLKIRIPAKA